MINNNTKQINQCLRILDRPIDFCEIFRSQFSSSQKKKRTKRKTKEILLFSFVGKKLEKLKVETMSFRKTPNNLSFDNTETAHFGPIADTIITTLSQDNLFWICLVLVEILALVLFVLCFCWMLQLGGFGFDSHTIFNFHPLCMTLGMIICNANGILIYRSTKNWPYRRQKTFHLVLQTFSIVISWIGFISVYVFHSDNQITHFYSLHSWLGLTALIGVTISLVTSMLTFYYPKASAVYCRLALPFHVFGGITNIALSAGICVIGITEKAIFTLEKNADIEERYSSLPSTAILLNMFGIVLVIFTILVVWMVTKPEFKNKYRTTLDYSHHTHKHYALRRQTNFT
ncbi:Cytochrome b reductase 1 [Sarcoptes scabiei]|nr:Cytochrome b reductase 1 [Sarcoptes scabiei]